MLQALSNGRDNKGTLLEVAASLSVSALLFLAIHFLFPVGMPLAMFAPVPLVILAMRRGLSTAMGTGILGAVLLGIPLGVPVTIGYLVAVVVPAFCIIQGLIAGWRPEKTVGIGALFVAVLTLGILSASLPDGLRVWVGELVVETITAYEEAGAPAEQVGMMRQQSEAITDFLYHICPLTFAWTGMLLMVASFLASRALITKISNGAVTFLPMARWHLPDEWIWALIAAAVLVVLPVPAARIAGGNLLGVLLLAYGFQGWAVLAHFFKTRQVRPILQTAIYMTFVVWPVLAIPLVMLGVFDMWSDARGVRAGEGPGSPSQGPPPPSEEPPRDI
ncbi:MAG: DUF2232 domain-containing protein [Leptospirillia bacterium]